jgi:hypothetical protein
VCSLTKTNKNNLVDLGDLLDRAGDEAGAGVSDGLAAAVAERVGADLDRVHGELPVALAGDGNVGEVADVVVGIRAAEDDLATDLRFGHRSFTLEGVGFDP